jgi:quercetin dioxygenase-like cupin family protein
MKWFICWTVALQLLSTGILAGQASSQPTRRHSVATCIELSSNQPRPEFGCFTLATAKGLHFRRTAAYWYLHRFSNREAAEAAKSPNGVVLNVDGEIWLSEFSDSNTPVGSAPTAVVGPLQLPKPGFYVADIGYAVMQPGDRSMVHTHPGPEGWYVLAGEQCLETPNGARRAITGGTLTVEGNLPMELMITGKSTRRSLLVVLRDSLAPRSTSSGWQPSGACLKHLKR